MKVIIHLDVNQSNQLAFANVVVAGGAKWNVYPTLSDQKRYEVTVDVPHPTDAEKLGGTYREMATTDDNLSG